MDVLDDDDHVARPPLRPPLQNSSAPRDREPSAADHANLRKWLEERQARKLRGEYESAVAHLSEIVNGTLHTPSRIAAVRVVGTPHTRASFLAALVDPHLALAGGSLADTLGAARGIGNALRATELFHTVDARVERAHGVFGAPGDVELVFRAREKGRFYINTSTEVGNGEGSASATGRVRNVFGGAETLEVGFSTGTKTRRSFHASLSAPLPPTLRSRAELALSGVQRDNSSFASSSEAVHSLRASVRTGTVFTGLHEFAYEAVLRHIGALTPTASLSMRRAAGPSVKSAVTHAWSIDTRDDKISGTRGGYARLAQELAGLGGDAAFYKAEAVGQFSRALGAGLSLSVSARAGALCALGGRETFFSDRFQLGGPMSLRMFRQNGLGPRDGEDSLGGDLYWAAGASLVSDIPRKAHWPVKAHLFVNAGRLDAVDARKGWADNVAETLARPSVSAGIGMIYRFDPVRVEVSVGVPLVASASDAGRRGIQVGMGIDFL